MVPTGQLAQQAKAGGYDSVRHMLNCLEGEDPDMNLEFDDNDDINQDDQDKSNIAEGGFNNEQNDRNIQHYNDDYIPGDDKRNENDEQCNSGNDKDEHKTAIKEQDTHEMIIDKLYKQLLSES